MASVSSIEKALTYVAKNPSIKKFRSKSGELFENLGNGCLSKTITKPDGSIVCVDYAGKKLNSLFEQTERGCFRLYPNGIISGMTKNGSFSANIHGDYLSIVDRNTNQVTSLVDAKSKIDSLISYIRHGSTNKMSVESAIEYFRRNPQATSYTPVQNFVNTGVRFAKGKNGEIYKASTRFDTGKTTVSKYVDGKLVTPKSKGVSRKIKSITPLTDTKISITYMENGVEKTIEAPRYLYHITSPEKAKMISSSGELRISEGEQVRGLYLLDSENFVFRYPDVVLENGKSKDLLTAIFRQAIDENIAGQQATVFRIPTKSLLSEGKLLIRKQEDFFEYQDIKLRKLFEVLKSKNIEVKCAPRQLANDFNRSELRRLVIENGIMTEKEIDALIADMTEKLHKGYSFFDCQKYTNNSALEYVYNKCIPTSDFARMGIRSKVINMDEFLVNGRTIDPMLIRRVF